MPSCAQSAAWVGTAIVQQVSPESSIEKSRNREILDKGPASHVRRLSGGCRRGPGEKAVRCDVCGAAGAPFLIMTKYKHYLLGNM